MTYQSLAELFLVQARNYGDRVLYRFSSGGNWSTLTWRESLDRVRNTALGLISLGVGKGDRIALLSANRVEWSLIDWANICIGALTVPFYPSSTPRQIEFILGNSSASVLFVDSADRLAKLMSAGNAGSVRLVVLMEGHESLDSLDYGAMRVLTLAELEELGRRLHAAEPERFEQLAFSLRPEDELTIIYTSGTTGEPKGVLTTHRHYLFMISAADAAIPSDERDVNLQFLPFAHSFGRLEHFMVVARGYTCGFARSIDTIATDLLVIRPTVLFSVPRLYENAFSRIRSRVAVAGALRKTIFDWAERVGRRFEIHQREGKRASLSTRLAYAIAHRLVFAKIHASFGGRLRVAISGGAPLAPEIAMFFHALGVLILEGYGLTETSTVSHANRLDRYKFGTVGLPLEGVECRIATDGEILVRGPNVFKGYYLDEQATREALDKQGWLHTGDIGIVDRDGFLRITDRKKDFIVTSGGKKIAPQSIENLIKADSLFSQAMVLGDGQPHLLALVTLRRDQVVEWGREKGLNFSGPDELASHPAVQNLVKEKIRHINKGLAPFEAIRGFRILPRDFSVENEELTPTLKLRRQVIIERYRDVIDGMMRKPGGDI